MNSRRSTTRSERSAGGRSTRGHSANKSRLLALALPACALILAACGGHKHVALPPTTTTSSSTSTTNPIGTPPAIKITPIANAASPTYVTQQPGDNATLYVTERAGIVQAIHNGILDATPVLDITSEVSTDGERGLLSMAFSPTNSSLFYVDFTDKTGDIHITEFTMGPDRTVDLHTQRDLLVIPHSAQNNHNGGQLQFGPDGDLYIGVGDGGSEGDPDKNGQNLTVLLGKILRINPQPDGKNQYTIPYDNPFAKQPGARGEIWAYGLRNPWRFSFDTLDGQDQGMWIGDVGQNNWEEVDHTGADPKGGENYGWSLREGDAKEDGDKPKGAIDPIYEYPHSNGACAITGGYVYRGAAIPALSGRYIFADYCTGQLMALTQVGTTWQQTNLTAKVSDIESFGVDNKGELYTVSLDGQIGRIDAG
jgi:glucose/arabinose dehydrogenase